MKVVHIINSMATGGAEKLIAQSLPVFEARGIETALMLLDGSAHPFMEELRAKFKGRIYHKGPRSIYSLGHLFSIIPVLKQYDLVHVHLFPSLYWVAIAKWLSFSSTKLVFTEHNIHNRRREKFIFKVLDKIFYRAYSAVTCITESARQALSKHIGGSERLTVVENGIDLEAIESAPSIGRDKIHLSLSSDDKVLVMVAGFRAQKDQATVIRAMAQLPEGVKLLLVGDGVLREQCTELVQSLDLEGRVLFLGLRSDVPSILKSSDVAILSSHWEGFGLAAVESMAAGIPFVASNVEGLAEVAGGAGVLFEKGNADELAAALMRFLTDPEHYRETAQACRQRAMKYDIKTMVGSFERLYKRLLS